MANISAHGKTKVGTLKRQFKEEYGVGIRIYNGQKFADDSATLASIRPAGKSSEGAIKINGNMLVGNLEEKFLDTLGIKVQIEDTAGELANNEKTLASLARTSDSPSQEASSSEEPASSNNSPPGETKSSHKLLYGVVIIIIIVGATWFFIGHC